MHVPTNSERTPWLSAVLVIIVLYILVSGCSTPSALPATPTATPSPSVPTATTVPTETPTIQPTSTPRPVRPSRTPEPSSTTAACGACGLAQVTSARIVWARWSSTGDRILYQVDDSQELWEYALNDCTVAPASAELILDAHPGDPDVEATPPPGLPPDLRAHDWQISPSGRKVVFVGSTEVPAPPPDWDGEWWPDPEKTWSTVCILDETRAARACMEAVNGLVDTFVWLPNEQQFLVVTLPRLPGTAYLWLGTLGQRELEPVLPWKQGEPQAVFEGLSPKGDAVLYHNETELVLMDLVGRVKRVVAVLPNLGRWYNWFLTESSLLLVDDFDAPRDFYIHIVDLDAGRQCRLSEEPLRLGRIDLSPGGTHLLIRWEDTRELHVYRLCEPCF